MGDNEHGPDDVRGLTDMHAYFVPLNAVTPPSSPPSRPIRNIRRNLVFAILAVEVIGLLSWARVTTRSDPNAFAFLQTQKDGKTPVAYNPCEPIHYVVREKGSPRDGQRLITDAVERVSAATGLRFIYDGPTDRSPVRERDRDVRDENGWAPVVVGWVTPEESPDVAGATLALGGSSSSSIAGSPTVYVTGSIALDAEEMQELLDDPAGQRRARAVILHELGHLVGLDHVDDEKQLMNATIKEGMHDFKAGDLNGLTALGKGSCVYR